MSGGAPRLGQELLNILLVDDNIFIRNCINQCLQHMGFRGMRGCSNGIDAIEYLRPEEKRRAVRASLWSLISLFATSSCRN